MSTSTQEAGTIHLGNDVRRWAKFYINGLGWQVVPLMPGEKACKGTDWLNLIFKPDDFDPTDNIGIRSVSGLVVVDLDAEETVALADAFLPETSAIYGRASRPRAKRLFTLEDPPKKTVVFKDVENATLVELRANHQDMAPPSIHPEGERLHWESRSLGCAEAVDFENLHRSVKLLATAALVGRHYNPPHARHEWCLALAGMLRKCEVTEEEATLVIKQAGGYAKDPKVPDRLSEVQSTYAKSDDEPLSADNALINLMLEGETFVKSLSKIWGINQAGISEKELLELNAKHAIVRVGRDELIARIDPMDSIIFQTERSFNLRYRNRLVNSGYRRDGTPLFKKLTRLWLEHPKRRQYENVVFAPTNYDPGIVRYRPGVDLNLWRGLATKPDPEPEPESRCSLYLELLRNIICDGSEEHYRFFLELLAWKVQNPGRISEVVVFLLGLQGSGKGAVVKYYGRIFRLENWTRVGDASHILGKFNALLAEQILIFIDEGIDPASAHHVKAVKGLATEETVTIERKGIDAVKAPNFAQLIVATNDEHGWYTTIDDRRALILNVSSKFIGKQEFWDDLDKELRDGGPEALLAYLLSIPTSAKRLRKVPMTQAKLEHIEHDLPPIDSYLCDALDRGTPLVPNEFYEDHSGRNAWKSVELSTDRWFQDFRASPQGKEAVGRTISSRSFGMRMSRLLPRSWKTDLRTRPENAQRGYRLASLSEARRHFDKATNHPGRRWEDTMQGELFEEESDHDQPF